MYTLYMHICPNGKKYVGQTCKKPEYRWGKGGRSYKAHNTHFWNAIQKYGWENIQHIIIKDGLTKSEVDSLEIKFIAKYHTNDRNFGYNKSCGGENSFAGIPFTQEHKDKISKALTGIKRDPSCYIGRHLSEETKEKIRQKHLGKKLSEEHKHKISESNMGRKCPKSMDFILKNCNCITVKQFDTDGNLLGTYYSLSEASRQTGVSQAGLSRARKQGRNLVKGFYWVFTEKKKCGKECGNVDTDSSHCG